MDDWEDTMHRSCQSCNDPVWNGDKITDNQVDLMWKAPYWIEKWVNHRTDKRNRWFRSIDCQGCRGIARAQWKVLLAFLVRLDVKTEDKSLRFR